MIWTKTSVSNTGPLVFPKSPKKNPPQNQPNRALQDELLSAGMPEAEVQPGDPTEKSGFVVAEIVGKFANLNGEQLKLHVFFFFSDLNFAPGLAY